MGLRLIRAGMADATGIADALRSHYAGGTTTRVHGIWHITAPVSASIHDEFGWVHRVATWKPFWKVWPVGRFVDIRIRARHGVA